MFTTGRYVLIGPLGVDTVPVRMKGRRRRPLLALLALLALAPLAPLVPGLLVVFSSSLYETLTSSSSPSTLSIVNLFCSVGKLESSSPPDPRSTSVASSSSTTHVALDVWSSDMLFASHLIMWRISILSKLRE
jgi:hypothetical protein